MDFYCPNGLPKLLVTAEKLNIILKKKNADDSEETCSHEIKTLYFNISVNLDWLSEEYIKHIPIIVTDLILLLDDMFLQLGVTCTKHKYSRRNDIINDLIKTTILLDQHANDNLMKINSLHEKYLNSAFFMYNYVKVMRDINSLLYTKAGSDPMTGKIISKFYLNIACNIANDMIDTIFQFNDIQRNEYVTKYDKEIMSTKKSKKM